MDSKTFATQYFFTDQLNHKTVNKAVCRTPSENPRQLWPYLLKSYRTVAIVLVRLSLFPVLSGNVFLITFKFS